MSDELRWHCVWCGDDAPLDNDPHAFLYSHGDEEKCTECGNGPTRVMTLREGARCESLKAQGLLPHQVYTSMFRGGAQHVND